MSSKKSKLQESAQKNFLKGQYDRAASEYRQLIQLDPADIRHRQRLAETLTKTNQKEEAIKEYSLLAKHYVDTIHYLKAIAVYKQIQKLDPANPEVSLTLATLNEKQGLIGNATEEFATAVQIYEQNGENLKALKTLENMLTLDTSNTEVRLKIIEKYFVTGSENRALQELQSLLQDLCSKDDMSSYRRVRTAAEKLFGDGIQNLLMQSILEVEDNDQMSGRVATEDPEQTASTCSVPQQAQSVTEQPVSEPEVIDLIDDSDIFLLEDFYDGLSLPDSSDNDIDWEEEINLEVFAPCFPVVQGEEAVPDDFTLLDIDDFTDLDDLELEFTVETESVCDDIDRTEGFSVLADEIDFDSIRTDSADSSFDSSSISGFKRGELDKEDAESHYSLGLAYKEMGLFNEAIAEFTVASHSHERRVNSLILQGVCFKEIGDIEKAAAIFLQTLQDNSVTEDERLGLQYELALCYVTSGVIDKARELLVAICAIRPDFGDAFTCLKTLQP